MDEVVVVGGLVPSLLIDQAALPEGTSAHVGTVDLDVGLKLALLEEGRYRTLTERLRDGGFVCQPGDHPRKGSLGCIPPTARSPSARSGTGWNITSFVSVLAEILRAIIGLEGVVASLHAACVNLKFQGATFL
jgi:hypothetical protein